MGVVTLKKGWLVVRAAVGPPLPLPRRGRSWDEEERSPGGIRDPPPTLFFREKPDKFTGRGRDALRTAEPPRPVFKEEKIKKKDKLTEKAFEMYLGQETGQICPSSKFGLMCETRGPQGRIPPRRGPWGCEVPGGWDDALHAPSPQPTGTGALPAPQSAASPLRCGLGAAPAVTAAKPGGGGANFPSLCPRGPAVTAGLSRGDSGGARISGFPQQQLPH